MLSKSFPLTVTQWRKAQASGNGLDRLLDLQQTLDTSDTAWISIVTPEQIREQWHAVERLQSSGHDLPLFGVPCAIKDNIDVAGLETTAACPDFAYKPTENATVVSLLQKAGAIVIGKTNLDQFATGLNGTRSPYGAVPNSFDPDYISGGSSAGSASVVARGIVPFSLGTDTAGSGRIPAGFNNIIGLKPTVGALSTTGVVPACRTLDCVTVFTLTTHDASTLLDVLAEYDAQDPFSKQAVHARATVLPQKPRIAVCKEPTWFGDESQKKAYERSLIQMSRLGWKLNETSFDRPFELAKLLYEGPWVAERYHTVRDHIDKKDFKMDETVRKILNTSKKFDAVDVFSYEYKRRYLTQKIKAEFEDVDAIVVPTSPIFPSMSTMKASPVEQNSILGTYTNFVNFLGWSAISIPAGFRDDELPFGVTIIAREWEEPKLLQLAQTFCSLKPRRLGATSQEEADEPSEVVPQLNGVQTPNSVTLAVVGAHLSGLPLNYQLKDLGGSLLTTTRTAPHYKLFELPKNGEVRKPGLVRVKDGEEGFEIELETWTIPAANFGQFVASIPAPLGIGKVELADGSTVSGFVCERYATEGKAVDVSSYKGWRKYLASTGVKTNGQSASPFKKILIANRGEIAVRLIATIKKLGIQTIAVHSTEDAASPHVQQADEAVLLEGDSIVNTYLDGDNLIKIAKEKNADAIIPGYGMLSENSEFARNCEASGICWIGPTPEQIRDLGLKHVSRKLAIEAGVPVVPGSGLIESEEDALKEADRIGYPILLKSTAGGGGIGLIESRKPDQTKEAFQTARRLSKQYFKDDGVFIEHLVDKACHVEIQIIGDGKGHVKHVAERDCSMQRRHQKIIEEAPASFVPRKIQEKMRATAIKFAASVNYRGVGTIEFLFDAKTQEYFLLEANTRLQVEHPVTEEVTGLDLVECMIKVAAGDAESIFSSDSSGWEADGVSIEARVYAENPLKQFRPSTGKIIFASFPENVRVDTWISTGTVVSSLYDPLLAKVIVKAKTRPQAVEKLVEALKETKIYGIETNLGYLLDIFDRSDFSDGTHTTQTLDHFEHEPAVMEVVRTGSSTSIQDWPGRLGYWHIGVPPSGPMDNYAMRLANRILGNPEGAAAIEVALSGLTMYFHYDATIAVVGPTVENDVDGNKFDMETPVHVKKGQTVTMGSVTEGSRFYLAVRGGIKAPLALGSASTFSLSQMGGVNGRQLRSGDLIPITPDAKAGIDTPSSTKRLYPKPSRDWKLRVTAGPHTYPQYFKESSFEEFFTEKWTVDYNSSRSGVRINGPRPAWTREDGGTAGLHPSNIHDSPYSIGSVSFTGDYAIILAGDGPSLGGFVVFSTVIRADLWMLGQLRSGDSVQLVPISLEEARSANQRLSQAISTLSPLSEPEPVRDVQHALIHESGSGDDRISFYIFGDEALLIEFGVDEFQLKQTFKIHNIVKNFETDGIRGILELTPGVRTIHVMIDPSENTMDIIKRVMDLQQSLVLSNKSQISSRVWTLPFAFQNKATMDAIQRYAETIWDEAPYVPSNADFLKQLNGFEDIKTVRDLVQSATFFVLGLGDVYLGSPCAVPLDPRHRMFGTKYSPTRSFTPEGTVGIGGQYMCIYGTNSPGGYQLMGRTIWVWDSHKQYIPNEKPWLLSFFDRVKFYPLSEEELNSARASGTYESLVTVEEGTLSLGEYENWYKEHDKDIAKVVTEREKAFRSSPLLSVLTAPRERQTRKQDDSLEGVDENKMIRAALAGRVWKLLVQVGDSLEKGQTALILESMKTEVSIVADASGKCGKVLISQGDVVDEGEALVVFE